MHRRRLADLPGAAAGRQLREHVAPRIDVNAVSLSYEERGSGEPVVLVHGGIGDHRIWRHQQEALGRSHRVIAYSCRHHGPGAPAAPDTAQAVSDSVDDLLALVEALGASPAHLVGHSFGGLLSLYAAIRAPERVRSLALLEPFALPLLTSVPPRPVELLRLALRHPSLAVSVLHFGVRGLAPTEAAFRRGELEAGLQVFLRAVLGASGMQRMTGERRALAQDNLEAFAAQLTRGVFPAPDPDAVRRIEAPALIVDAEESPAFLRLLDDALHTLIPHAERASVPDASHDMHVDHPSAVTQVLRSFLEARAQGAEGRYSP